MNECLTTPQHEKQIGYWVSETYVTNGIQDFVKCCIKTWMHLDIPPDNMLFGRPQPVKQPLIRLA